MATAVHSFDTQHEDIIHDAQLDYYGKRLATCSSDHTVRIFEVSDKTQKQIAKLAGHEGPVWQVCWAHPQFGNIIASCSYDHRVIIWRETGQQWANIFEYKHEASVNSICWAPHEVGLCLASASSDGVIAITSYKESDSTWDVQVIRNAHDIGCNTVSWGPSTPAAALFSNTNASSTATTSASSSSTTSSQMDTQKSVVAPIKQLVSGGGDNKVKIWRQENNEWLQQPEVLEGHGDWIRDVAWAPNVGLPYETIAVGSQDRSVSIWTKTMGTWNKTVLPKFSAVVWRVSWSVTGNILAVTTADNQVTLWKDQEGKWIKLSTLGGSTAPLPDKK